MAEWEPWFTYHFRLPPRELWLMTPAQIYRHYAWWRRHAPKEVAGG